MANLGLCTGENTMITRKQSLERLANLYTLVRSIPRDNRFNMSYWAIGAQTACGTAACAAGHAALHPWFRRRGLGLKLQGNGDDDRDLVVSFKKSYFTIATDKFFGLGSTADIFLPTHVRLRLGLFDDANLTPKRVSRNIKDFMVEHFTKDETNTAIKAATVVYNLDYVHKYSPYYCEEL
jgi:hypothetical protein